MNFINTKFDILYNVNTFSFITFYKLCFRIDYVEPLLPDDASGIPKRNPVNPHNFARKIEGQSFWNAKSKVRLFQNVCFFN